MYPSVTKVEPRENYQIYIEFDNDECGVLNMEPYLDFGVFRRIRDLTEFTQVRVSFDTVEWSAGIDLDPQFVYEKCTKDNRITRQINTDP
ncbi:MAG: DUF2442 domain-containing protein [Chromatiaceae bacterium]